MSLNLWRANEVTTRMLQSPIKDELHLLDGKRPPTPKATDVGRRFGLAHSESGRRRAACESIASMDFTKDPARVAAAKPAFGPVPGAAGGIRASNAGPFTFFEKFVRANILNNATCGTCQGKVRVKRGHTRFTQSIITLRLGVRSSKIHIP